MLELKGFFKLLNVVDVICQAVKFEIVEDTILWAYAKARDVSKKIVDAKTKVVNNVNKVEIITCQT